MNLKLNVIGAAVVLALAAGSAQAALVLPSASTGSDLTFNIYDANSNAGGYTLDLGSTVTGFNYASPFSVTLTGSGLSSFTTDSTGVLWDVVGASGNGVSGTNTYYTTSTVNTSASDTAGQIQSALSNLGSAYGSLTTYAGQTFTTSSTGSVTTTIANTPYWAASFSNGGGQINDTTDTPADSTGTSTSSQMFFESLTSTSGVAGRTLIAGFWSLVFNGVGAAATSATLTWTPTGVPLPAAVWLFGSGLLGLAGIGRRRLAGTSTGSSSLTAA